MNPIIEQNKKIQYAKKNILAKLANIAAKICLKYNASLQEFTESYKSALVKLAKKQNPDYSIVELACRTGIDRRYINQYLNDVDLIAKPSKIKLILEQIKLTCKRTQSKFIQKSGPFQTFESICIAMAPGSLTYNSIAKELIRQGNIIEKNDKYEIIELNYTPEKKNLEEHIRLLTIEMNRLVNTVIYNAETQATEQKQFQRNLFSTQIPPENLFHAKYELSKILIKSRLDIENFIIGYEDDVPVGTYAPFGASMFVFGYDTIGKLKDSENDI